jgi:hypothetical protein
MVAADGPGPWIPGGFILLLDVEKMIGEEELFFLL